MSTSERGMHWGNPSKEVEVQETEKENWMFCKVYKENQKELMKNVQLQLFV